MHTQIGDRAVVLGVPVVSARRLHGKFGCYAGGRRLGFGGRPDRAAHAASLDRHRHRFSAERAGHCRILGSWVGSAYMGGQP
jgi:hypothetical protein